MALTAAGTVTRALLLGTGVALIAQRDPIITAKEVATLDQLSNGRFLFGVGIGWNREEMESHGTDPKARGKLADELLETMQAIWTREIAEYHGDFVNLDPLYRREQFYIEQVMNGLSGAGVLRVWRRVFSASSVPPAPASRQPRRARPQM